MKKAVSILVCALATLTISAQHLTFKGIPIDGTLKEFVTELKKEGFQYFSHRDGILCMFGDFAGYQDCIIPISIHQNMELVNNVMVVFPEQKTWAQLYDNYFTLKEMLIEKYGEPFEEKEGFDISPQPDNDRSRIRLLKKGKCLYPTDFIIKQGIIKLFMEYAGFNCVILHYIDGTNALATMSEPIDDL